MSRKTVAAFLGFLIAAVSLPLLAETYIMDVGNGTHRIRWKVVDSGTPGVADPIPYYINTANEPFGGASTNVQNGIEAWNGATGSSFRWGYAGTTTNSGYDVNDNQSVITFDDPAGDLQNGVLAAAVPWHDPADTHDWDGETFATIIQMDIVYNDGVNFGANATLGGGQYSIEAVSLHESGHGLGLDHPDQAGQNIPGAVMNSAIAAGDTAKATPTADDEAGVGTNSGADPRDGLYRNTVPNVYPDFDASATQGYAPLTVNFTNQSQGGSSYTWNFGDGGNSTAASPSHTYNSPGTYNVTLTVNGVASAPHSIFVATLPQVDFNADKTSGSRPLTVTFSNLSNGNITGYTWDFGDATFSNDVNPSHEYLYEGTYNVTLTADGEAGPVDVVKDGFIVVGPKEGSKKGPFAQFMEDLGCNCAVSRPVSARRLPIATNVLLLALALGAFALRRRT